MKHFLLFTLLLCAALANSQAWTPLVYNETQPGLETNPLKGFSDLFEPNNAFPNSISAKLFYLDEVMLGMNNFDWTAIDNYLLQEVNKGNHSYIQVNIDPANGTTNMPDFLVDQVEWYYDVGDPGNGVAPDSCPNWNNQLLMDAMLNFVDSFGLRYNDDPRIFMVHLGLYGLWGEWHIGSVANNAPEFEMTEENRLLIANAYQAAFPDKMVLARYPEHMPDPQDFGYSDGLFFTQSFSNSQYDHGFFHNTLEAYNSDENWKRLPVGGEIDPCIQPFLWEVWPNYTDTVCYGNATAIQNVELAFDKIRPTWLFSHHIYTALAENTTEWDNALRAQRMLGYTFYIDEFRLSAKNGFPTVEVNIQNKGLAPMYANWDIQMGVFDSSNDFQLLDSIKWDMDLIIPDLLDNYRSFKSTASLVDGTYKVLLRMVNPLDSITNNAKPVRFANTTQDDDLTGWITLGELIISGGDAGTSPTPVTGISIAPSIETITVGDDLQLTAVVTPVGVTNDEVTWVSNHSGTASVDENGLVSAGPAYGPVIISAYTQDGGYVAERSLTIEPIRVTIPAFMESEDFIRMTGIAVLGVSSTNAKIGFIDQGDWLEYAVEVTTPAIFTLDVNASSEDGSEVGLINETGDTLQVIPIADTDDFNVFLTNTSAPFSLLAGDYNLRILSRGEEGLDLDWMEFKVDGPLPGSYTFLGTLDDQFMDGGNWDAGAPPPNNYDGLITIQADCVAPKGYSFLLRNGGQLIVDDNVELIFR